MRTGPILLYVIGIAVFCVMDAVMKTLVQNNPAVMATFWRYVSAILFTGLFWLQAGRPRITREMLPVHLLRGSILAVSATLFFWSLSVLSLTQAVTIAFSAPLLIPPIAALMLKERMQAGSVMAGIIGFAGVLVAVGFEPEDWQGERLRGVAAALGSAVTYAVSTVLMRLRAARDGPAVLSLLGAIIPAGVLGPVMLLTIPSAQWLPQGVDWLWVAAAGASGVVALQFIARAYARAEAQVLAPFEYTALGWAALLGWVFFDEPVLARTWAGALIVAGACLWQARKASADRAATVETPSNPAA
ncbi:MAG: DMT family transporter [Sandaracinobacter sp.]